MHEILWGDNTRAEMLADPEIGYLRDCVPALAARVLSHCGAEGYDGDEGWASGKLLYVGPSCSTRLIRAAARSSSSARRSCTLSTRTSSTTCTASDRAGMPCRT